MPYSIRYDEQYKMIEGAFFGEVNNDLLRAYSVEANRIQSQINCRLILTDYSNAIFSFTVLDLYHLPQKHNKLLLSQGLNIHEIKRAAIFDMKYADLAKFYEDVAVNRGQIFKAFTNRKDACEWLFAE